MNAFTSYAKRASEQKGIRTAIFGTGSKNVFIKDRNGSDTYTLNDALEIIGDSTQLTLESLFEIDQDLACDWSKYVENEGAEIYLVDNEPNLLGSVNPFTTIQELKAIAQPEVITEKETTRFAIGSIYSVRSIGDQECVWTFEVVNRTEKFVTVLSEDNEIIKKKITILDGIETIKPLGSYSMAPILRANNLVENPDRPNLKAQKEALLKSWEPTTTEAIANKDSAIDSITSDVVGIIERGYVRYIDSVNQYLSMAIAPATPEPEIVEEIIEPEQEISSIAPTARSFDETTRVLNQWATVKAKYDKHVKTLQLNEVSKLCKELECSYSELAGELARKEIQAESEQAAEVAEISDQVEEIHAEVEEISQSVPCEVETPYKVMIQLSLVSYVQPVRYRPEALKPMQLSLI